MKSLKSRKAGEKPDEQEGWGLEASRHLASTCTPRWWNEIRSESEAWCG